MKQDPLKKKAGFFALALHLIGFFILLFSSREKEQKIPSKIVVRTVQAPSQIQTKSQVKKPPAKVVAAPVKTPAPSPSVKKEQKPKPVPKKAQETKQANKIPVVKKPIPASKPSKPTKSSKELEQSLKKIEETIAKIATKGDTIPIKHTPSIAPKIEIEDGALSEEEEYISSLVYFMQAELELPDMGEVKIELTLRRDGGVEKVRVLEAESERNRKRLAEHLPLLQFPPFPKGKQGMKMQVFILPFCNEM
jgi:outer membrane biosynthesis protein TonB